MSVGNDILFAKASGAGIAAIAIPRLSGQALGQTM
jgi:hypothetical protein